MREGWGEGRLKTRGGRARGMAWGISMGEEEAQSGGGDGGRMEVRGRWRKKVKDIVPNKKADVDLSVWLSKPVGLC